MDPATIMSVAGTAIGLCFQVWTTLDKVGIDFPRLFDSANLLDSEIKKMKALLKKYPGQLGSIRQQRLEECGGQCQKISGAAKAVLKRYPGLELEKKKKIAGNAWKTIKAAVLEDLETLSKDVDNCQRRVEGEYLYITLRVTLRSNRELKRRYEKLKEEIHANREHNKACFESNREYLSVRFRSLAERDRRREARNKDQGPVIRQSSLERDARPLAQKLARVDGHSATKNPTVPRKNRVNPERRERLNGVTSRRTLELGKQNQDSKQKEEVEPTTKNHDDENKLEKNRQEGGNGAAKVTKEGVDYTEPARRRHRMADVNKALEKKEKDFRRKAVDHEHGMKKDEEKTKKPLGDIAIKKRAKHRTDFVS